MLAASPIPGSEEHAIHDYEGFEGVRIQEYTGIETIAKIAEFITAHGTLGGAVLAHYCGDLDEASEAIIERYHGCFKSLADYVQEITEDRQHDHPADAAILYRLAGNGPRRRNQ